MAETPDWIDKSPEEIEELAVELAEKGNPPSKVGKILRDQYGIPSIKEAVGKNMHEVLESNDVEPDIPEDLMNLMKKAVQLRNHLDKNPNDTRSQRSLEEFESRIHRLIKYYKREKRLPEDWRYEPEEAALLVRG